MRPVPSPATGPQPDASTSGVSGDSGVESIDQNAPDCVSSVSGSAWRRGNRRSGSRAHVDANVRARSSSSAIRSIARSRIRRGSTSRSLAPSGSTSVRSRLSSTNQGSQLSMPSKCAPSDSRSHCSRPHGSVSTSFAAVARTSSVGISSRAGKMRTSAMSPIERWSFTPNVVSRSTSSPHRSMRIGASAVEGYTSMIAPRRANSPRCSTSSSRRYPNSTSVRDSSSGSISAPGRTMTGSIVVAPGPSFCSSARTPVTMIAGTRAGSRKRHRISRRWPIVSTLGLTRSNGSVSQPGKWTTSSAGRNWRRSSASWPAMVPVGHVTISGRLDER